MDERIRQQIEENYKVFQHILPSLVKTHPGKFALMKDGEIVAFFDTPGDAYIAGQKLYENRLFSIQEIKDTPIDLGFFSHALS